MKFKDGAITLVSSTFIHIFVPTVSTYPVSLISNWMQLAVRDGVNQTSKNVEVIFEF